MDDRQSHRMPYSFAATAKAHALRARLFIPSDAPALNAMASQSGFPYPSLADPLIEAVQVVVDYQDQPIAAVAAKRLIELYLYIALDQPPAVKLKCLELLHSSMAASLREIGYNSVEAFIPGSVAGKFGRRLERTFGWIRNWASWTVRF